MACVHLNRLKPNRRNINEHRFILKPASTGNQFRENTVFSFVFEKNTHRTATKTFEGKKDPNRLFGVPLRLIPQFILGLAKYLVYCLTVIWLTINNNTGRLLRNFAPRFRIGNVAREWIWVTTVLAFVLLLCTYGCEDFNAPEKDSGTSARSAEGSRDQCRALRVPPAPSVPSRSLQPV